MNEYFSAQKVRNNFKKMGVADRFTFHLKNISINGQRRGCSGFVVENSTGRVAYITTEPFFKGGLCGNKENTLMYRAAENLKDYRGGTNHWGMCENVAYLVSRLFGQQETNSR